MLSSRHMSHHKLKQSMHDSLKKQRELSNRINVLMIQKQRRLKQIQKRVIQHHDKQQLKMQREKHRQQMEHSFQQCRNLQQNHHNQSRQLKKVLSQGINIKQAEMLETKQKWYQQIKKMSQNNENKILKNRSSELQAKKLNSKRVRLMQINCKENVKQYWKDRIDFIKQDRTKDNKKNNSLFQNSLNNISILEEKQKKLLREIRQTLYYDPSASRMLHQQIQQSNQNQR